MARTNKSYRDELQQLVADAEQAKVRIDALEQELNDARDSLAHALDEAKSAAEMARETDKNRDDAEQERIRAKGGYDDAKKAANESARTYEEAKSALGDAMSHSLSSDYDRAAGKMQWTEVWHWVGIVSSVSAAAGMMFHLLRHADVVGWHVYAPVLMLSVLASMLWRSLGSKRREHAYYKHTAAFLASTIAYKRDLASEGDEESVRDKALSAMAANPAEHMKVGEDNFWSVLRTVVDRSRKSPLGE